MSEESGVTLTITGSGSDGGVTAPGTDSGELWKQDQERYDMIETIVMNNIVAVADYAFTGLKSLKKVDSASLQTVGAYAFADTGLTTLSAPSLVTIWDHAFQNCVSLGGDLQFASVTSVGAYAFEGAGVTGLDFVELCSFEEGALKGCTKLQTFKQNSGSTGQTTQMDVANSLFEGCSALETVSIPGFQPNPIGDRAFFGCASLTSMIDLSRTYTIGESCFEGCGFVGTLKMSSWSSLSTVGARAFKDCRSITSLGWKSDAPPVKTVPESCFEGCTSLTEMTYMDFGSPVNMHAVGKRAFAGCVKLTSLESLHSETTEIMESAFEETGFIVFDMSETKSLSSLGSSVFKNCPNLEQCTLPSTFNLPLPEGMFEGCGKFTTLTGGTVTEIGARAFSGCSSFTNSEILSGVTQIGSSAFEGTGLTAVDLSASSMTSLASGVFKNCQKLEDCELPELKSLSESVFEGCVSFVNFTIPSTVEAIGVGCFKDCTKLTTVTYLGDSEVTNNLFEGCTMLSTVEVKEGYPYEQFGGFWFNGKPVESSETILDSDEPISEDDDGIQDSSSSHETEGNPLSPGAIAGITIAVLVVVAAVVAALVFLLVVRRRQHMKLEESHNFDA